MFQKPNPFPKSLYDNVASVLVEYGTNRQIFADPRDPRTQAYVTGRVG